MTACCCCCCDCSDQNSSDYYERRIYQQKESLSNSSKQNKDRQLKSCLVKKSISDQSKLDASYCKECEMEKNFELYLK